MQQELHGLSVKTLEVIIVSTLFGLSTISLLWSKIWGPNDRDPKETLANLLVFAIGRVIIFSTAAGFQFAALIYMSKFALWTLPKSGWMFVLTLIVVDFIFYWRHRFEHEWGILWAEHSVHHSSGEYNFSTALRQPWSSTFHIWLFLVPPVLFGFAPFWVILSYQIVLVFQFFVHTKRIGKLGILEKVFNTPSNHRVHHGRNPRYIDKNYGGILVIWDLMFGTYVEESEDVHYGTVYPINSQNPFVINLKPWMNLFQELRKAQNVQDILKTLFTMPPPPEGYFVTSTREEKRPSAKIS